MDAATSPIQELANVARAAKKFRLTAVFDLIAPKRLNVFLLLQSIKGTPHRVLNMTEGTEGRFDRTVINHPTDVVDAMRRVASSYPKARLRPETIQLTIVKGPLTASKLKPVVVRAWHEAFGLPVPTPDEQAAGDKARKSARKAAKGDLIALLKAGEKGVRKLNRWPLAKRGALDLRKADLAGAHLAGANFAGANLEGADLSGASLLKAKFFGGAASRLKGARLVKADLRGAWMPECRGSDADFSGANLAGARMAFGILRRTRFVGADLSDADLAGSDLRGADFTDAKIDGLVLKWGKFDETTRWPAGYLPPPEVTWTGAGPDPRLAQPEPEGDEPSPADLPGLLDRLKGSTDPAKLDKAMAMLKADRFQLFAKVAEDHLVGVVKSQSDETLVYACRLADDGRYACCTQNLNVCGGLRGSPCKHLLVLIVGLARAGQLDPGTAHTWTRASRGRKPVLDKDAMAEVFLRYKGAEAGELDWRPTETIPEDFYAM
jgi:Pentapeptide repeats (8 copies)